MAEYDGINSVVCEAEESDWLDISYTQRNYIGKKQKNSPKWISRIKSQWGRAWKIAAVAVLCLAVLSTLLFTDGNFKTDVFEAVKTASASIFEKNETVTENTIDIPCNLTLVNVENGVMTFGGGRAALALLAGKVTNVTEDSVTVSLDDNTSIVYSRLTNIMVALDDQIEANSLLGKYDGEFCASLLQQGEVVTEVVGKETQLVWNI